MTAYQVSWYLGMGGPHGGEKYQVRRKSNKNCKISQKSILQFSEAPLHIPWCFICQKNSRASLIKWLKGYSVIFTYGQEISNQSTHTNRETPCRWTIKITQRTKRGKPVDSLYHGTKYHHGGRSIWMGDVSFITNPLPLPHILVYAAPLRKGQMARCFRIQGRGKR